MNCFYRKRGQTNRDVFGALRCAVSDPLARFCDDRLAGPYDRQAAFVLHYHFSGKNQCKFLELGALPWFRPSCRAPHVRDAGVGIAGIHTANVLVEKFSLRNGNAGGNFDQSWHYSYRSASTGAILVALRAG